MRRTLVAVVALLGLMPLPACSSSGTPSNRPTEVLHSSAAGHPEPARPADAAAPGAGGDDPTDAPDTVAGPPGNRPPQQQDLPQPEPTSSTGPSANVPALTPPPHSLPDNVRVMPDDLPPLKTFHLPDQFDVSHAVAFPAERITVIAIGDRDGSPQLDSWTVPLVERFGQRVDFVGVALVTGIAPVFRGFVRGAIQRQRPDNPVLIDWTGEVTARLDCEPACANIYLVRCDGSIVLRGLGAATPDAVQAVAREIGRLLGDAPADE